MPLLPCQSMHTSGPTRAMCHGPGTGGKRGPWWDLVKVDPGLHDDIHTVLQHVGEEDV